MISPYVLLRAVLGAYKFPYVIYAHSKLVRGVHVRTEQLGGLTYEMFLDERLFDQETRYYHLLSRAR